MQKLSLRLFASASARCRSGDRISGLGIPRYPVASIVVLQPFSVLLYTILSAPAMSERTGLSISQVTDEVLYAGLVEMQELPEHEE